MYGHNVHEYNTNYAHCLINTLAAINHRYMYVFVCLVCKNHHKAHVKSLEIKLENPIVYPIRPHSYNKSEI